MDIAPFVDQLQEQLVATAAIGGEELEAGVRRLAPALDATARLALLAALTEAAAEITGALGELGSVDARLDGRRVRFVVEAHEPVPSAVPAPAPEEEGDAVARVSLRLPEDLKNRADAAAQAAGQSLNAWLIAAVRAAVAQSTPGAPASRRGGHRHTGWN